MTERGCDTFFASPEDATDWLMALPAVPGDTVRLCGTLSFAPTFSFLPSVDNTNAAYSFSPCYDVSDCQESAFAVRPSSTLWNRPAETIVAGQSFTCAMLRHPVGAVRCWGDQRTMPVYPYEGTAVAQTLFAGRSSACLIRVLLGRLDCFGEQSGPQQGTPWATDSVDVIRMASSRHCLLLKSSGRLRCWASSGDVELPGGLPRALDVAVNAVKTCILARATRLVWCWTTDFSYDIGMVILDTPPVQQMASGDAYWCAILLGTGEVLCRWLNDLRTVDVPLGLPPAMRIAVGSDFACVLLFTRQVRCWLLRVGGYVPSVPADLPPVATLTCGYQHVCVVVSGSGQVRCFGDNQYGQSSVPPNLGPVAGGDDLIPGMLTFLDAGFAIGAQPRINMTAVSLGWSSSSGSGDGGDVIIASRTVANASAGVVGRPVAAWYPAHLLDTPQLLLHVQREGMLASVFCSDFDIASVYEVSCAAAGERVYGVTARSWNGVEVVEEVLKRPGNLTLIAVRRSGSIIVAVNAGVIATSMTQRLQAMGVNVTIPRSQISAVRPGDTVELVGTSFGLHAGLVQAVPWWNMSAGNGSTTRLRSCVHLAWWASLSSYHSDSACVCNGREDWLGEGEVPLSAIRLWNDTHIRFAAPVGEGIREVRLCVEGQGLLAAPTRSASSFFIVYEPPSLVDLLPASYAESTDFDTPISLVLRGFVTRVFGPAGFTTLTESWGRCEGELIGAEWNGTSRRWDLTKGLPLTETEPLAQHCTALVRVEDSVEDCYITAGTRNASDYWSALGLTLPRQLSRCYSSLLPVEDDAVDVINIGEAAVADAEAMCIAVPLPFPVSNAVLGITYTVSTWDNGVLIRALSGATSRVTFRRIGPSIRSISPAHLLLGPTGGVDTEPAVLTLFGLGFRTPEEIDNPSNALTAYGRYPKILVDDVECANATITRQSGGLATATCVYPSHVLLGRNHTVTFELLGQRSVIPSADDRTLLALTSACAPGYYGLRAEDPGPKTCRPCPRGGICLGGNAGSGKAPIALPGFYNVGRPPVKRSTLLDGDRAYWPTTYCPEGAADGGRGWACILPCDPPEACTGANQCAPGYESAAPEFRCARCEDGYYRSSGVCTTCPVIGLPGVLLLMCVLIVVGALAFILSTHSIRLCTVNTVVEYAQVVSMFSRPNLPWPQDIKRLLQALSIFRVNIEVTAPECYSNISVSPETKLWIVLVLPLIVLLTSGTLYLFLGLAKRLLTRQYSHGLGEEIGVSHDISAPSKGLDGREGLWSHGPAICRATLKLLAALYLPVVQSSLEVWNCTPTDPPDGNDYLSIVFEPCGVPGGLQQRMVPWAITGLALYGFLYPALLAAFMWFYHDLIVEDQLLRACRLGADRKTNPVAYSLRRYTAPLYEDYKPGYHYSSFLTLARKSVVCICALMLTKSPIMVAASICIVVTCSLILHMALQPLMTPGSGFAVALAEFEGRVVTGRSNTTMKLHSHLAEIASRTSIPILADLAAGRLPSTDVEVATRPWWALCVDWNYLEAELQLQVVLTGILSILYSAAKGSVYEERSVPGITAAFFALLFIAFLHVSVTVGYDVVLQLQKAVRDLLELRDARTSPPGTSKREAEVIGALHSGAFTPTTALYLFCCRCFLTRERARAIVVKNQSHQSTRRLVRAASMKMASWVANPIDLDSRSARADLMAGKVKKGGAEVGAGAGVGAGHAKQVPGGEIAGPVLPRSHGRAVLGRGISIGSPSDAASRGSDADPAVFSPKEVRGDNPLLAARAGDAYVGFAPTSVRPISLPEPEPSDAGTLSYTDDSPVTPHVVREGSAAADSVSLQRVIAQLDANGSTEWVAMRDTLLAIWSDAQKRKMA